MPNNRLLLALLVVGQASCSGQRAAPLARVYPAAADQAAPLEAALMWYRPGAIDTFAGPPDTTVYLTDTVRLVLMLQRSPELPPFTRRG